MECHFCGIHDRGVQNLKYAVEESSIAIGSEEEAHAKFGGVMEMYHDTVIYLYTSFSEPVFGGNLYNMIEVKQNEFGFNCACIDMCVIAYIYIYLCI